ncbi:ras GEF [Xylariaceae sp. FL1272]|nr:ras GEF [Xylariaceae sp. FL1272]
MDTDPLALHPPSLHPPLPIRPNLNLRDAPKRNRSNRDQRSPKALGQDTRTRRSPTLGKATGMHTSPVTSSRSLIPAIERRAGDHKGRIAARKASIGEKWSPNTEAGAGREGRQFTVANVGNNGRMFLRYVRGGIEFGTTRTAPDLYQSAGGRSLGVARWQLLTRSRPAVVRPGNQRYAQPQAQPQVTFPVTPPSTAGLDSIASAKAPRVVVNELKDGQWSPLRMADSPSPGPTAGTAYFNYQPSRRHRRAMSDSTIRDLTGGPESGDTGAFKVVISKAHNEPRSRTAEDLDANQASLLQVTIPSWKLGTPRFTTKGVPLIRGSSYAPTEDLRSNHTSFLRLSPNERPNDLLRPETLNSQIPSSLRSSQIQRPSPTWLISSAGDLLSPRLSHPICPGFMPTNLIIEPAMFDSLTFKPACNDRSIVRYSSQTGAVTAATPPRLVAEITSTNFLDYDLISDFFLSFRSFVDTPELLRMLIARLRWALAREDESGMIVKVRTFVAIRHWILNYFVDDFVIDYPLRVTFCDLVNDLADDLSASQPEKKVTHKIVGELKKCWRRVCAQYWDGPDFDADLAANIPITPGGIAGHRDPNLNPGFWERDPTEAPQLDNIVLLGSGTQPNHRSFRADVSNAGHIDSVMLGGPRPATPEEVILAMEHPASPMSTASVDVMSCSFPTKNMRTVDPNSSRALGAHPVDPSSIYTNNEPIASTPRALTGKRVRPQTAHRRNNSLTDSLRGHGTTTEKVLFKDTEFMVNLPYAGSLVRGNILPPGRPFVEVDNEGIKGASRQTTILQSQSAIVTKKKASASAMSSQGMRRLLGSVRRALSTRGHGISPTQGSFIDLAPLGPRGATTNRIPGTAVVPQAQLPRTIAPRQGPRIDLLGARVAEDFKKAVREDAETKSTTTTAKSIIEHAEYSAAHFDSSFNLRPLSDAAITTGSKSIVIVDGTTPHEVLTMTGALPPLHASIKPSKDTAPDENLTPPMTPPSELSGNTGRRSSHVLGQDAHNISLNADRLPSFGLGAAHANIEQTERKAAPVDDVSVPIRPSVEFVEPFRNKPPSSYVTRHKRQQSSASYRSRGSLSQRRWASFHSGLAAPSTIKSFDATTTYSDGSTRSEIMPQPLRMLRRKPGGDLRGATNVAELEPMPLRRSHSIGSLTAYSESLRTSYIQSPVRDSSDYVDIVSSDYSQNNRGEVFSLGAMAEPAPKNAESQFSTLSSKPIMRPSFEAEAQKLAQIPDDIDDDGGVESALLKLEGKYERKTVKLSIEPSKIPSKDLEKLGDRSFSPVEAEQIRYEKKNHRHQHVVEEVTPITPEEDATFPSTGGQNHVPRHSEVSSFLSEDSRETYNSVPLLDRGMTDEGRSRTHTREWTNHSILEGPDSPEEESEGVMASPSLNPSFEFIEVTASLEGAATQDAGVKHNEHRSFLHIESDIDSDLSSELSAELVEPNEQVSRPLSSSEADHKGVDSDPKSDNTASHNLDDGGSSIQLTLVQALQMSPDIGERQLWPEQLLSPTPDTTPTTAMYHQALERPADQCTAMELPDKSSTQPSCHLPFILGFDSDVLAQQFTLIEKDALNEVDWRELIEMKWKDSHNDSRSWVDFLRNSDARGVEVVIARFNIMVKWAISEIVLTTQIEERARCIIKYLHIAAHCRYYRNFATMSQIVVALTSNEVARLSKTWSMVPPTDMKIMAALEMLVSPTKNFYNLRAEMEGGGSAADAGCIPFVGIYTHDLLFNSQRPSEIASSPTTPPLVNFERCRIAASIVKTVLRLLEASTYYQFQPIEGITERCLWMSALSDDEIRARSGNLE